MIIANGLPKSGTHALMAWLDSMGLKRHPGVLQVRDVKDGYGYGITYNGDRSVDLLLDVPHNVYMHGHIPFSEAAVDSLDGAMVITMFRDPRNVLVSYARYRSTEGPRNWTVKNAVQDFWGEPFVPRYRSYLGWRGNGLCIRFEDTTGVGDGAGIYAGRRPAWDKVSHNTRTGAPSDWSEWWTPETQEVWERAGGPGLLEEAGYAL